MSEGQSLDDILNEQSEAIAEPIEATQEPEAYPETDAPASQAEIARDDAGRFAKKGEDSASPAPEEPKLDHAAIVAERRRRQEAEQRAADLEAQLQAYQAPPPSVFEDEEGWQQHFGNQVVGAAVQQASLNAKLDMSEMLVRQANPDFEDVKAEFLHLAETNPQLAQQALSDPHPWNKAYQIAKNYRAMQDLGATDMDSMKAKMREELLAEMQGQIPVAKPGLPPTLTGERNVGTRSGPSWTGPKSLSELLG